MPILNWIGKDAVVNHDKDVPFRLLKKNKSKSVGDSENLIIEGDNLEALKALLPHYQNKIKCVYIDPPYNTGNEKWVYNDNVNSPKIKKWLGKVVGGSGEDLTRHDKWLCMMYPRLKLLRELLREDGVIFVSIDDDEHNNLLTIMKEIFGEENFISNIVWQKKYSPQNDAKYLSDMHDFIIVFAKKRNYGSEKNGWIRNLFARTEEMDARYKNPDNDPRGDWKSADLSVKSYSKDYDYTIVTPSGREVNPPSSRCWMTSQTNLKKLIDDDRISFGKSGDGVPRLKQFLTEVQQGMVPVTWWDRKFAGHNQDAAQELKMIFGGVGVFPNPKPKKLIKHIIELSTNKNDLILDSFAGSGTTAHAVLELNKENKGNRKFILIELESKICKNVTSERVKKVITGYSYTGTDSVVLYQKKLSITDLRNMNTIFDNIEDTKSKNLDFEKFNLTFQDKTITLFGENSSIGKTIGTGEGFQYAVLDKKLFNSDGRINETCTFEELASYIYFTETKTILDTKKINKTLLGTYNNIEYYLIFEEIGKNNLNRKFLTSLDQDKNKVIYADKCALDDSTLEKYNTVFKQIPYEVREF